MAIRALEDDPLPVEGHDAVLHLKAAEADLLRNDLADRAVASVHRHHQVIQHRILCAPELRLIDLPCVDILSAEYFLFFHPHAAVKGKGELRLSFAPGLCPDLQLRLCKRLIRDRTDPHVSYMHIRDRVEIHIPVYAREAEEILILAPAPGGPFKHLDSQLVLPVLHISGQFKLGRREAVAAVSDKCPVQPQGKGALRPLERNKQPFPLHALRHGEIFHIACHRIEIFRDLTRTDILAALPRILGVRILGRVISFHLDVGRHTDIIPALASVLFLLESFDRGSIVFCIMEFPQSVQALREFRTAFQHVLLRGKI